MKHLIVRIAFAVAVCTTLFVSCKKETPEEINPNSNPTTSSSVTLLCGTVTNRNGIPIQGADIVAGSSNTTTDDNGYFSISNFACGERCYVHAARSGYFDGSVGVISEVNGITSVSIKMMDNTPDFIVTPTSNQNLLLSNGAGITLQGMSVDAGNGTAYTGQLNVAVFHHDPSATDFFSTIPGGDLIGSDLSGATKQLFSYGMLGVQLTDASGTELQLLSGMTATVNMPVPASMLGDAPATIPLWHYNETTGIWIEEGSATLTGNNYVGSVTHFSVWNCDLPSDRATVTGLVRDCNNQPVSGVQVNIGQGSATTNTSGHFQRYVPTNMNFNIQVNQPSVGLVSQVVNVQPLANAETYNSSDLNVDCPAYVSGTITCNIGGGLTGYVSVNTSGITINAPVNSAGNFQIAVPANGLAANVTMVGLNHGVVQTTNTTLPSSTGQSANLGTFDLCGTGSNTNLTTSFIINGGGYNNTLFTITSIPQYSYIVWSNLDNVTYGYAGDGSTTLNISCPEATTGTWNTNTDNAVLGFFIGSETWVGDDLNITVNQWGNVGSIVTGTFSGTIFRFDGTNVINATVSNGTFQMIRNPDQD